MRTEVKTTYIADSGRSYATKEGARRDDLREYLKSKHFQEGYTDGWQIERLLSDPHLIIRLVNQEAQDACTSR